jgi:Ca-activated chloride channel family protein
MMPARSAAICALLLVALALLPAHAGEEGGGPPADPWERAQQLLERVARGGPPLTDEELEFVLRHAPADEVEVRLLTLAAVVLGRDGRPVPGLTAEDFTVLEDGEPRPIVWLSEEPKASFRLALLIDVSTSMRPERRRGQIHRALLPLMREVRRIDRVKLLSFSEGTVLAHTDWVRRPMTVLERAASMRGSGKTALLDALAGTAGRLPRVSTERHAIVMVTDAIDNASRLAPGQVVGAARAVSAPVYVIALGGLGRAIQLRRGEAEGLERLEAIASETGGRLFLVGGEAGADPERVAHRIREDLRHQYLLGFEPSPEAQAGEIRRLEVEVAVPGAQVLARKGYRR